MRKPWQRLLSWIRLPKISLVDVAVLVVGPPLLVVAIVMTFVGCAVYWSCRGALSFMAQAIAWCLTRLWGRS